MIGFEYYNPAKIVFGEDSGKSLKSSPLARASWNVKSSGP